MAKEKLIGGAADFMSDRKFNKKELRKGIREEREHTNDPQIAKEIAKDHLAEECPKYYTHLAKLDHSMNKEAANSRVMRAVLFNMVNAVQRV